MNCTDCQEKFTEILDDDAPADMAAAFTAHLTSCPSCASEFSGFKKTVQTLQTLAKQQVPADFLIGINEKLDSTTFTKVKNWFAFMGQHKLTASATVATLVIGVISATVLQTPNINEIQLSGERATYTQAITTQQEAKINDHNYYPGVPYLASRQPEQKRSNTILPGVQFASTSTGKNNYHYGVQPPRGSPNKYATTAYTSLNLTRTNPKPDFHIVVHPASASQQQKITRTVAANSNWKTHLHNSTLFVTLTDEQLPEFQELFPPSAPPHKRLDLSPLTRNTDRHLFTIAISFK